MWFVINVKPGLEEQAVELLRSAPETDGVREVFCPMAVGERKERGEYVAQTLPMFDGCAFAIAPSKWELRRAVRHADGIGGLLEGDRGFEPMEDGEGAFISEFAEPGTRTVAMSEAVVRKGGGLTVTSGPLKGYEQEICKRSGRARWAYLDTRVAGKPRHARLGLRVTKNDSPQPCEQ